MKKTLVVTLLLVVYLIGLIALTPARFVMQFIDTPPDIELADVSGTIWNGRLGTLRVDEILLHDIRWRLSLLPLITGRAQLDFEILEHPQNLVTGRGRARLSANSIELQNVSAEARLVDLVQLSPVPSPVEVQGQLYLNLINYHMGQPLCAELDGSVQLAGAAVRMGRNWIEMGDFNAQMHCEEGRAVGVLDEPNSLGLNASMQLWDQGGEIVFELNPPADAPRTVRNLMSLLPDEARQPQRLRFNF